MNTSELVAKIPGVCISKTQAQRIVDSMLKSLWLPTAAMRTAVQWQLSCGCPANQCAARRLKIASRKLTYSPAKAVNGLLTIECLPMVR